MEQNDQLLVVKKFKGPYAGMFDLPGGRPNHGEDIYTTLRREFREETGIQAHDFTLFGNYSFLVPYNSGEDKKELHHCALIHIVKEIDSNVITR